MDEYVRYPRGASRKLPLVHVEQFLQARRHQPGERQHSRRQRPRPGRRSAPTTRRASAAAGGIDLFLGGVGEDRHIRPSTSRSRRSNSRTRLKTLTLRHDPGRNARVSSAATCTRVPKPALDGRRGHRALRCQAGADPRPRAIEKARAVRHQCVEGPSSRPPVCTISALQVHPNGIRRLRRTRPTAELQRRPPTAISRTSSSDNLISK